MTGGSGSISLVGLSDEDGGLPLGTGQTTFYELIPSRSWFSFSRVRAVDGRGGPAGRKLNVFISYCRDDLRFADQLDAAPGLAGVGTTMDRTAIAGGEEWEKRLGALIHGPGIRAHLV